MAIAALRDDTDKNQWLVLDHDNIWEAVKVLHYKGDFILCNHDGVPLDRRNCLQKAVKDCRNYSPKRFKFLK